tara:strand:+ start:237 stop:1115 length:879 start_codon:yes stop_codon:yes gene_type:complete
MKNKKKPKIIGMLNAWGAQHWIGPAIEQAKLIADEVHVAVTSHSNNLDKFEDKTLQIAKDFSNIFVYEKAEKISYHSEVKSLVLNNMIKNSKIFKNGNWLWILDVDEFYSPELIEEIRGIISTDKFNSIDITSRFFYINMKNYLESSHRRLFKIQFPNLIPFKKFRFRPTQNWFSFKDYNYKTSDENPMFHYAMLTNPHQRAAQWQTEYPNSKDDFKQMWINQIYKNYDLKNQDYWINENLNLFNIKSPWCGTGIKAKSDGKLFFYDGKHPKIIENSKLKKVNDFRKFYNFK